MGLRLFLLDNSGSTRAHDGHVLRGDRLVGATRWQEICASAEAACQLGAAVGVPCEFHLLNPHLGGDRAFVQTGGAADDLPRLRRFLESVTPSGVTPLAERLRALRARFRAFAERQADGPGTLCFLVLMTDGAPTPVGSGTPTPQAARAALDELRSLTISLPVRLVVRLCTDEESAVDFWNTADAEEELPLDVRREIAFYL